MIENCIINVCTACNFHNKLSAHHNKPSQRIHTMLINFFLSFSTSRIFTSTSKNLLRQNHPKNFMHETLDVCESYSMLVCFLKILEKKIFFNLFQFIWRFLFNYFYNIINGIICYYCYSYVHDCHRKKKYLLLAKLLQHLISKACNYSTNFNFT